MGGGEGTTGGMAEKVPTPVAFSLGTCTCKIWGFFGHRTSEQPFETQAFASSLLFGVWQGPGQGVWLVGGDSG